MKIRRLLSLSMYLTVPNTKSSYLLQLVVGTLEVLRKNKKRFSAAVRILAAGVTSRSEILKFCL